MKLERLTLHGFKSFADRTELRFHDGITAVVGPNGCGKSNISDAIRWVLGEQRASAIRGSKMEEAIFQGTAQRRGLNRAEVSLAFSNADRRLAVAYDEIEVRRTLFREGGSEYQLNKNVCRLRDIHDLLRDTGLGANSYAVIEQRMVDAILSDRTDDRRQLFEEAAGIGRYKDRRKAAQRRLEAAETDLARLDDLIAEVESKVRSLARQRRRAQRYQEMRDRRLALDVTLAAGELETLQQELESTDARLAEIGQDEPATRAALGTAEAELERRRLEAGEAARTRAAAAARLEDVGRRIAERDRELAVADERRVHAERRLTQLATEREELRGRIEELRAEAQAAESEREMQAARLETLSAELEEVQARQASLREEVLEARRLDERARQREQELARLVAAAEARASGADARAAADRARLERLEQEREELLFEISRLEEQGDLFAEQLRGLAADRARLEDERDAATEHLAVARNAEAEARRAFNEAEDRANLLASQLAALEALEREHHGFHPAVAAALAAKDRLDGLLGPLSEFLDLPPDRAAAVEHALGSILQLLVVRDAAAAERVRQWIEGQEGGAGGDTTDQGDPSGQGTTRDESGGEGAVAIILEAAVPRVRALVEEIVFAGEPADGPVLLGRRQRLDELRAASARAREERDARASAREEAAEQLAIAEETLRVRESTLQDLDLELRRAEADEQTWSGQNTRLERTREELDRRLAELRVAAEKARAEASAGREERSRLADELERHREEWQAAGDAHADREAAWEAVRDEEAELRVLHARAESAVAELDRRLAAARGGIDAAQRRLQALDREEGENRASLEQLATIRSEAGAQLEDLFQRRAELAAELRTMDEALEVSNQAAQELEARVRELRRAGQERGEERHRLELRRAEAQAAVRSARERLEAEWARPFDQLLATADRIEGDPDTLRAELQAIAADIERLGPVNMLAVEEHEEESQRLEFLTTQRDDLVRARDDLQTAIRQINRTARTLFLETFEQVRENFARTFTTLFEGGTCDLRLSDPEDPLESDVEISASPGGKRTQRIHLLSGGERALTSLALLFAVYLVKPSPFCVLDEVDAPLDEANVGRFIAMLQEFKRDTQFIVITHNPRTMEAADWIYGVTMEEPGVSSIVGVELEGGRG